MGERRVMRRAVGLRGWVLALAAGLVGGCFTEVGNPGKNQGATAEFRIVKSLEGSLAQDTLIGDTTVVSHLYFNIVEANYRTEDDREGRIWKVADSLGKSVDFTRRDTAARLPPVQVPPGAWNEFKLESRVPAHQVLDLDTLVASAFAHRGYVRGKLPPSMGGALFICQLPNYPKVNLVYDRATLDPWLKHEAEGDVYHIEVVFYADDWMRRAEGIPFTLAADSRGDSVAIFDQEHNTEMYSALRASFFRSFNSWRVWKEGDSLASPAQKQVAARR